LFLFFTRALQLKTCKILKLQQLMLIARFLLPQKELLFVRTGMGLEKLKYTWRWIWKGMWRATRRASKGVLAAKGRFGKCGPTAQWGKEPFSDCQEPKKYKFYYSLKGGLFYPLFSKHSARMKSHPEPRQWAKWVRSHLCVMRKGPRVVLLWAQLDILSTTKPLKS